VIFLAFGPSASAATYFVSTTGSDTNTGLSGFPWRTITHALAVVVSGDIVNVAAGTYDSAGGEVFPLPMKSGVVLKGPTAVPPTAIIQGSGPQHIFASSATLSNTTRVSYFKFDNFSISSFDNDIFYFNPVGVDQRPVIDFNEFVGHGNCCSAAVHVDGSGSNPPGRFDGSISNNTIHDFYYGVNLYDSGFSGPLASLSPLISGNTFTNNNTGVRLSAIETRLTISNGATTVAYSPTISGNTFSGGATAIVLSVSGSTTDGSRQFTVSPTVSGNNISGTSGNAIQGDMSIHTVKNNSQVTFAPQILNNSTITSIGGDGMHLNFSDDASTNATVQVAPSITGNSLSTIAGKGIVVPMYGWTYNAGSMQMNPTITNNTLSNISGGGSLAVAAAFDDLTAPTGPAILVPMSLYPSSTGSVSMSPTVSGNTVTTAPNGIKLAMFVSGIGTPGAVGSTANLNSNHIFTPAGTGIVFSPSTTSVPVNATWSVSSNDVHNAGNLGIDIYFGSGTTTGSVNLGVTSNQVTNGSNDGINVNRAQSATDTFNQTITIDSNIVTGNGRTGIGFQSVGSTPLLSNDIQIKSNTITGNGAADPSSYALRVVSQGWTVSSVPTNPTLVSCNTITNNSNNGVLHGSLSSSDPPADFGGGNRGSVGANQIHTNSATGFDFYNLSPTASGTVPAKSNWWGTTNATTIDSRIHDDNENASIAAVDFSNFKLGPPTTCAANNPPVANADSYAATEDTPLTVSAPGVLSNDTDVDGNTLTAILNTNPSNGTVSMSSNGSFTYTPNANFNGFDSFTYYAYDGALQSTTPASVTINVAAVNDAPVANADSYTTTEDIPLIVNSPAGVLVNDTDVDGNTLTANLFTGPANGTLTLVTDGSFTYTPNANFNGTDSFTYKASDGSLVSSAATVTITVTAVNDPPVANADSYSTAEDTPLVISAPGVLSNDTDPEANPLTAVLNSSPANGTLTFNSNGSFTYTPNGNFSGTDSFTYKASDGASQSTPATVTITVTPVNDPPVAVNDFYTTTEDTPLAVPAPGVLSNDSDPDGNAITANVLTNPSNGTLSLNANGSFTYTPNANFNGFDTFTYKAFDGTAPSSAATVSINVVPANDPPVANADSASTAGSTPVTINVLSNDTDVDGNTLTITSFTQGANGTVTCSATTCTYTANTLFSGTDSFTYTISDGAGGNATATVSITVAITNADLSIDVSASPDPAIAGEPFTYTINVTNSGPTQASNVHLDGILPDNATFAGTAGPFTCSLSGRLLDCTLSTLGVGSTATLLVRMIAPTTGTSFVAEFGVGSSNGDPTPNNNVRLSTTLQPPAPKCTTTPATLLAPANGAVDVPTSVTFSWSSVPNAIGYTVFGSINGGALQELGSTSAPNTSLEVSLGAGTTVSWFVRARFAGDCVAIDSTRSSFTIEAPDTCESHGVATLLAPTANATVGSSNVTFQWNPVRHADKYRIWTSINGAAFAASEETLDTRLQEIIPFGAVEWYVEALFNGCPSTESAHGRFTVPTVSPCNNNPVTLLFPSNGVTVRDQSVDFTWNPQSNAIAYEVYLSLNSGTPVLLGRTPAGITTFHKDVAPGDLEWFVRALYNGCAGVDSQHFTFTFARPQNCPDQYPIVTSPANAATELTSPVTLAWSAVPRAQQYQVRIAVNGGAPQSFFTTAPRLANVPVSTGSIEWSVEALTSGCPSLLSTVSTFTVVPPPPPCSVPETTEMRAEANASSNVEYVIRWDPSAGATSYELQEATRPDFVGASTLTVDNVEQSFKHSNDVPGTVAFYYYRVRGVNTCGTNVQRGSFSPSIAIGILPPRQADASPTGATPVENPQTTTYQLQICTTAAATCSFLATAGQTFTARTDQPWLTVSPSSGTVAVGGTTLTVTATPTGLGVGTNTGTIIVTFGSSSATGRFSPNADPPTGSTNVSVNLVAPVANTPKNTPPPDALIIPAVAHADGLNSHFESDIRVSNTSPKPMKYQLTFTPSGETGIKDGKQTTIDIDPGRTVALDDVLSSWFGAGTVSQAATGALEIRPLTASTSTVSSNVVSGLPNIVTFATSRTYSTLSSGSLGTFVPAIPFANFIGKGTNSSITLQQIAQTSASRTNLGLVEGSGQPATVLIKMFNATGQQIGSMTQQLTGGQHLQINSLLARQNQNNVSDGRVEISVTSATGKVTAYASVLDNTTNDAQLVSPVTLNQAGSAKYVLAGVADQNTTNGKTQSDVRLFNTSSSPVTATLALHVDGSSNTLTKDVTIAPGQVQVLDNALQTVFGVTNVGNAALHVTTAAPVNLIATAKTYTQQSAGSIGQFISAVTPQQAITAGSRPLQLLQVEESNRVSTDVGIAEVSGKSVDLEITVIPQDAKVAAKTTVSLGANEFRTMKQLLKSIGVESAYNARVTVKVVSGAGAATAYASTTDLATRDTTFIPAQ
jgi:VCBS repeat-containing protein